LIRTVGRDGRRPAGRETRRELADAPEERITTTSEDGVPREDGAGLH